MDVRTKALRSILWSVNKSAKTAKATAQMGKLQPQSRLGIRLQRVGVGRGAWGVGHLVCQADPRQMDGIKGDSWF